MVFLLLKNPLLTAPWYYCTTIVAAKPPLYGVLFLLTVSPIVISAQSTLNTRDILIAAINRIT